MSAGLTLALKSIRVKSSESFKNLSELSPRFLEASVILGVRKRKIFTFFAEKAEINPLAKRFLKDLGVLPRSYYRTLYIGKSRHV